MNFLPGQFRLKNAPIAVVLAQLGMGEPVRKSGEGLRDCLKPFGLERLTKKFERNVTIGPNSPTPIVQDRSVAIVLDRDSTRGVSVVQNLVSYFTSRHTNFHELLEQMSRILPCLSAGPEELRFSSIGLRYVNAFEIRENPTEVVRDSLGGLERTGLPNPHYHHTYEYWCDTDNGRLTARFSTNHGDRKPKELSYAEAVYPAHCLWSYDQTVGHLDIFETSRRLQQAPVNWESATEIFGRMNRNIEQAFLNAMKTQVLIDRFGAEEL